MQKKKIGHSYFYTLVFEAYKHIFGISSDDFFRTLLLLCYIIAALSHCSCLLIDRSSCCCQCWCWGQPYSGSGLIIIDLYTKNVLCTNQTWSLQALFVKFAVTSTTATNEYFTQMMLHPCLLRAITQSNHNAQMSYIYCWNHHSLLFQWVIYMYRYSIARFQ